MNELMIHSYNNIETDPSLDSNKSSLITVWISTTGKWKSPNKANTKLRKTMDAAKNKYETREYI